MSWSPKVLADGIVGNLVVVGENAGTIHQHFAGAEPIEPKIPWQELPSPGIDDVFPYLTWQCRLVPEVVGQEALRDDLLRWAKSEDRIQIRILSGEGGAGKSRVAHDVAERLRGEGWMAGSVRLDRPSSVPISKQGLFLVLDYPEEWREAIVALLRGLTQLEEPPAPIRILLLSRQPAQAWERDIEAANARRFCDMRDRPVPPLADGDLWRLWSESAQRFATHKKMASPKVEWADFDAWLKQDPGFHRRPLTVAAAALHAVLHPPPVEQRPKLALHGRDIVQSLVQRERGRMNRAGRAAGFGDFGASRLAAIATVAGELTTARLTDLAAKAQALQLGLPDPATLIDRIRAIGHWRDDRVPPIQPDIVGAAFAFGEFQERQDAAPAWLWAALRGQFPGCEARLNRIAQDVGLIFGPGYGENASGTLDSKDTKRTGQAGDSEEAEKQMGTGNLLTWLATMACQDGRLQQFAYLTEQRALPLLAPFVARIAQHLMAESKSLGQERAARLNNLAVNLADSGDRVGALAAVEEAAGLYRELARANPEAFRPALATSLNNLGNRLSEVGRRVEALAAVEEAAGLYRELARANPARFKPDLARSHGSLGRVLERLDREADARDAYCGGAALIESMAQAAPGTPIDSLYRSLSADCERLRVQ
jgi:tetratricopeptide (TPR) repeat protein